MQNKQSTAATLFLHPLPPTLWVSIYHVISTKVRSKPDSSPAPVSIVSVNDCLIFPLIAILLHLELKFTSIPSTGLSKLADIQTGPHLMELYSGSHDRIVRNFVDDYI